MPLYQRTRCNITHNIKDLIPFIIVILNKISIVYHIEIISSKIIIWLLHV